MTWGWAEGTLTAAGWAGAEFTRRRGIPVVTLLYCMTCLYLIVTGQFPALLPAAVDLALHLSCPGLPAQVASSECHKAQWSDGLASGLQPGSGLGPVSTLPCFL